MAGFRILKTFSGIFDHWYGYRTPIDLVMLHLSFQPQKITLQALMRVI